MGVTKNKSCRIELWQAGLEGAPGNRKPLTKLEGVKVMSSNSDNTSSSIDYESLVEEALRDVVKSALKIAQTTGLPEDAHFYISFKAQFPGSRNRLKFEGNKS